MSYLPKSWSLTLPRTIHNLYITLHYITLLFSIPYLTFTHILANSVFKKEMNVRHVPIDASLIIAIGKTGHGSAVWRLIQPQSER
jgi:hypothetical protein